ncbi:MAG: hypothetical protein GY804_08275 [Alphaproteobacteria bacterium]|nr:hypothetical protein [Alphaproteobacteria bacterium]
MKKTKTLLLFYTTLSITFLFSHYANAEWSLYEDSQSETQDSANTSGISKETPPTQKKINKKRKVKRKKGSNENDIKAKIKRPTSHEARYCFHYTNLYKKIILLPNGIGLEEPINKNEPAPKPAPASVTERHRFAVMSALAMGYVSAVQDITQAKIATPPPTSSEWNVLDDLYTFCTQFPKAPYEDAVRAATNVNREVKRMILNEKRIWRQRQGLEGNSSY